VQQSGLLTTRTRQSRALQLTWQHSQPPQLMCKQQQQPLSVLLHLLLQGPQ
jgi:hypothetical protein